MNSDPEHIVAFFAPAGCGIGTHSMKLFGERYLKGKVGFTSREPGGTTFSLVLPKLQETP